MIVCSLCVELCLIVCVVCCSLAVCWIESVAGTEFLREEERLCFVFCERTSACCC